MTEKLPPLVVKLDTVNLAAVGALAVQFVTAESNAKQMRLEYLDALKYYVEQVERIDGQLCPRNPAHAGAIAFTAPFYSKYKDALRVARNLRNRMNTAARKAMK